MSPLIKMGIVGAVAVVAWGLSRSIDGPIVHLIVTGLAALIAWNFLNKGE